MILITAIISYLFNFYRINKKIYKKGKNIINKKKKKNKNKKENLMTEKDLFDLYNKNYLINSNQNISSTINDIGDINDIMDNSSLSSINNINPGLVQSQTEKGNNSDEEIEKNNISNIAENKPKKKINNNNEELFSIIFPPSQNKKKEFHKKHPFIKTKKIKSRFENQDNILVKIKRLFFNGYIYHKVNSFLNRSKSRKKYGKYGQNFIGNVKQDLRNKNLWNSTFEQFCLNKNFCENRDWEVHKKNLDAVQSVLVKKNEKFQTMLNTQLKKLFDEFIKSDKFRIYEISRLEKQGFDDSYLKKYTDIAKNFIKIFTK